MSPAWTGAFSGRSPPDERDDGETPEVREKQEKLLAAVLVVRECRAHDGVLEGAFLRHARFGGELRLGVRRSARVGHRRRRNVDEVTNVRRAGRAHQVDRAIQVDASKDPTVVRKNDRRQVVDGVDAVASAVERDGDRYVAFANLAPASFESRAQRVSRKDEPAHLPTGVDETTHEASAHHTGCTGDESLAVAQGGSCQCPPLASTASQSMGFQSPTASSREANSQMTAFLPASRSSPASIARAKL